MCSLVPAHLHCVGTLKAGASVEDSGITVRSGEAVEIMTGAPVPAGADAVVMVEYTESTDDVVTVNRAVEDGRKRGAGGSGSAPRRRDGEAWHPHSTRDGGGGGGGGAA